jgi:uncharacterized membrane protein YecN with MAPEG domain
MLCARTQYRVSYGDGGFSELQSAIRVHGTRWNTFPLALILLLFMEMNGANLDGPHLWYASDCGRLMHYYGFHHRLFRWRRSGMSATWCSLLLMVLANFGICRGSWFSPSISAQYAVLFFPDFNVMSHRDTLFPRLSPAWATGPLMNG